MLGDRSGAVVERGGIDDGTGRIKVLMAVVQLYAANRRVTIREVCDRVRLNLSTVHTHLERLRQAELVTWERGTHGTLRPLVQEVGFGDHRRIMGL